MYRQSQSQYCYGLRKRTGEFRGYSWIHSISKTLSGDDYYNDDAASQTKCVKNPNPVVSTSVDITPAYNGVSKTLHTTVCNATSHTTVCDVAAISAGAKGQCTNDNKVTIGIQCDDTKCYCSRAMWRRLQSQQSI